MGFIVWSTEPIRAKPNGHRYIEVVYATFSEALATLDELLDCYPASSPWHRRLEVREVDEPPTDLEACARARDEAERLSDQQYYRRVTERRRHERCN